jgi:hypothetical protein
MTPQNELVLLPQTNQLLLTYAPQGTDVEAGVP